MIDQRQALLVIQIGQDFERSLQAGKNADVQVIADGRNSNTAGTALGYVSAIVDFFNADWATAHGQTPPPLQITTRAWYNPNLETRWNMVPALIGTLTMLQTLLLTAMSVAREREQGTFDQLLVTPFRPAEIKSGGHDQAFYQRMWQSVVETGSWQGEIWNKRKNGEVYPQLLTITAVRGTAGEVTHYVGAFADITQRKATEREIEQLAFYDPLTRLPNRRLLRDRLQQALASSVRSKRGGALLFIDLDNFKTINDTLGHDKGDQLLQQAAQRLVACVRESDTVGRLGGDEFVVILEGLGENRNEAATQAKIVAEKILAALSTPYHLASHECDSRSSIGSPCLAIVSRVWTTY